MSKYGEYKIDASGAVVQVSEHPKYAPESPAPAQDAAERAGDPNVYDAAGHLVGNYL